jgi:hypothetical protein
VRRVDVHANSASDVVVANPVSPLPATSFGGLPAGRRAARHADECRRGLRSMIIAAFEGRGSHSGMWLTRREA